MNTLIIDNEVIIRLGFFFAIFAFMAVWEFMMPRRKLEERKREERKRGQATFLR